MTCLSPTKRRPFTHDKRGSVAIIFAIAALVVCLAIGLAVDGARAYNISSRVSSALDSAALAAAKMLDDEDNTNAEIEDRARRFFLAHFDALHVHGVTIPQPQVTIRRDTGEVEVAVAVSVKTTIGQLAGIDAFDFPRVSTVRYDQKSIELAMVLDITGSMCQPCSKIDSLKSAAKTLVANVITPETPYGRVRVAIAPYSAAVNAGAFAEAVSGGESTDGCVVERTGAQNATDIPPNGGNALGTSRSSLNDHYHCPSSAITPLTADAATLTSQIDALNTNGFTAGHIGLAWGWYMITHKWNSIWPTNSKPKSNNPKIIKSVLLMTDGEFNTSYITGPGWNATSLNTPDSSPEQAQRLCDNMKADGVIVYTVAFQAPASAQNLLASCATSSNHYFPTSNDTELVNAFRTIAERLTALRITGS